MTITAALIGLVAYFGGAAYCITRVSRRVDAVFARDMQRVLRSRAGVGSALPPDRWPVPPGALSGAAGVERGGHPHSAAAPPATQPLAGVALNPSSAAPARPPRQAVLLAAEPACGYPWGDGCMFGGGAHSCAWPASQCTGAHKCGCGAGASS